MLAAVRIATLSLVIVCLAPAYQAMRAGNPDAWDVALLQTRAIWLAGTITALAALGFIWALVANVIRHPESGRGALSDDRT